MQNMTTRAQSLPKTPNMTKRTWYHFQELEMCELGENLPGKTDSVPNMAPLLEEIIGYL